MCADEDASMLYLFGGLGHVRRGVKKSREGVPGAMMRVRMLVARDTHSDLWVFDAATGAWEMMNFTAMSPPPRRGHTVSFSAGRHLREDRDDDSGGPGRGVDDGTSNASQHGDFAESGGPSENASASGADGDAPEAANKQSSVRLLHGGDEETPKYLVLIGGAGPDPKGFENVLGSPIWCLDLLAKRWFHLPTTGCVDAAARFEHTTTRIGEKLWVVGGMTLPYCDVQSDPNQDLTQPAVTTSTLKWGNVLSDVASLDLETLVWTRLDYDGPRHPIHGHAACEHPTAPGELLIVGGYERVKRRHAMPRRGTVNALVPKSPQASVTDAGGGAATSSSALSPVPSELCAEDLEDTIQIKSIRVGDAVPVMRRVENQH